MKELTLIYNNSDPSEGGIPRFNHRIIQGFEEENIGHEKIDFTEFNGKNTLEKIYNLTYGRRKYIKERKDKLSEVNLFLHPEVYFNTGKTDIVVVHDLFMKENPPKDFQGRIRNKAYIKRLEKAFQNAEKFIAVSTQTKQKLIQDGINEEKISVVNHGVREKFSIQKEYSERENRIGCLGGFIERKRVGKLLKDFQNNHEKLEDYKLILGGTGGEKEQELKKKYSGKEKIQFEGKIPEENLVDWYNNLKALIMPSELEGFGLPILEAIASGTPVFVYEDAKIPEEVKKHCHKINSVEEISENIENKDAELKKKSERIHKEFSWDKTVHKVVKTIETV